MDEKECTKCGKFKGLGEFYKKYASCKECVKEAAREYRARPEVKEQSKLYGKEYRQRPDIKDQRNKRKRKYSKIKKHKEHRRQYMNQYASELRDGYIRNLLCRQVGRVISTDEIPSSLVIVKRAELELNRQIKHLNDA